MTEKERHVDADLHRMTETSSDDGHGEWTEDDEKRIKWKMDLRMIPTVLMLYLMCFIDR